MHQQPVLTESDKKTLDKVYEAINRAIESNPKKMEAAIVFYLSDTAIHHLKEVDKYRLRRVHVPPSKDPRECDYYIISW